MNKYLYPNVCVMALLFTLLALTPVVLAAPPPPPAPVQPQAVIPACDPITSNTTWTTGNVYVVENCNLVVAAGVTLTIQPGVIVKFWGTAPGYGSALGSVPLIIEGTLTAVGSAADPIIFTSYADDAHGGDTNGDGAGSGTPGDWYGLLFQPGSVGQLEYFFVGYAGSGVFNARVEVGYGRAQVDVKQAAVTLRYGTITAGLRKGIYLEGAGMTPRIENVTIASNNDPAWNQPGYAIYQDSINMQPTYGNLTFSGNDRDEVTIGRFNEAMTQSVTLGGTNFGALCGYTLCQLTVPNGITLTVQPGTLLDLRASYGIAVADGGSLRAEGTPTQPVTFTSNLAAGGDTGQYWMGLWAQQDSTLRLDHCDISYANNTNYGLGGLEINTDDAVVNNCHLHHHNQDGLYLYARGGAAIHPVLNNVDVTDNGRAGVYLEASSGGVTSVTWDGGQISRNGWSGMTGYTSNSTLNPTLRNLTIAENGAAGDLVGRYDGLYWNAQNVSPMLESLTITGNVGTAISWLCNGSIMARNLTAADNGTDELTLPGCTISGGRQWDVGDAGIPVRVTNHIEVASNALLSLTPGTTLRFDKNQYDSPTYLRVQDQAALYALGAAERPIIFTGAVITTTGWWAGIEAVGRAAITLRHCEIGYGGFPDANNLAASLVIRWGAEGVPTANIQNCTIHHSGRKGVHFDFYNLPVDTPPVFRYNRLHDNTQEAVTNFNAPPLDARDTYWGDPTGPYHATQNPGGLGDAVGDNILFYPWLGAPAGGAAPGEMLVSTGAPTLVSPGQTVDYAIQYFNGMTETVQNALLVVQLPGAAEYVASSGGGGYWPERDQVFWNLGDLPPGSQGFLAFQVRFAWGLPRDYSDSSITLFTGDNYNPGELDTTAYADYQPGEVNQISVLSPAEFAAARAAAPDLQAAYDAAITAGYTFYAAANVTRTEGETILEAVLAHSGQRAARILALQDGQVLVYTLNAAEVIIEDATGGMRIDLLTGEKREWGDWQAAASQTARATTADGCTVDACKRNCRWSIVGWEYIKKKAARVVAWTALAPFTGGASLGGYVWEIGSTAKKLYDCDLDCRANPQEHCCTAGQVRWSGAGLFGGMTNSCYREKCNATTGTWVPDGFKTCIAFGERCVAGIGGPGCTPCEERGLAQQVSVQTVAARPAAVAAGDACAGAAAAKPRCRDLNLFVAKDPNAIYGPAGDLLPGQVVTYTLTYENEGAGRAYGVYVVNALPEVFDARTLSFTHGSGVYLPESRELFWLVGELGPKGAADSEGVITYTVALTGGLPSGTMVVNQAVVYFPSVPEETPTNSWVNHVAPLAATPQALTTAYMTPLALTLHGREISGLPLTYAITEPPRGGTLTGTLPHLTYTPAENFTGADGFSFQVSNGVTTSRATPVYVTVTPSGDTTPPQVLWTNPATDATNVTASVAPVLTDTLGPAYTPVILIGVSEALSATTVTSVTVTVARVGGATVPISARFDEGLYQIVITPRAALAPGSYRVAVTDGVADLAGNPLAADYTWQFSTSGAAPYHNLYLPLILRQ